MQNRDFIFITSVNESQYDDLEKLLISYGVSRRSEDFVVCFDSCSEQFTEKVLKEFPHIFSITNNKNSEGFAANINRGINYAVFIRDKDVILLDPRISIPRELELQGNIFRLIKSDPEPIKEKIYPAILMYIQKEVVEKIGLLDGIFNYGMWDKDFIIRAKIAGFNEFHTEATDFVGDFNEVILGFNAMKFGSKWSIQDNTPIEEFEEYLFKQNFEWLDGMKVDLKG